MANYRASGEENLRADPKIYHGSDTPSPSGGGKDVGGTENMRADQQTKTGATKSTPSGSDHRPAGVQSFEGMAKQ